MTSASDGAADPLAGGREAAPERDYDGDVVGQLEAEQQAHSRIGDFLVPLVGTPDGTSVGAARAAADEIRALRSRVAALEEALVTLVPMSGCDCGAPADCSRCKALRLRGELVRSGASSGPPEAGTTGDAIREFIAGEVFACIIHDAILLGQDYPYHPHADIKRRVLERLQQPGGLDLIPSGAPREDAGTREDGQ